MVIDIVSPISLAMFYLFNGRFREFNTNCELKSCCWNSLFDILLIPLLTQVIVKTMLMHLVLIIAIQVHIFQK